MKTLSSIVGATFRTEKEAMTLEANAMKCQIQLDGFEAEDENGNRMQKEMDENSLQRETKYEMTSKKTTKKMNGIMDIDILGQLIEETQLEITGVILIFEGLLHFKKSVLNDSKP